VTIAIRPSCGVDGEVVKVICLFGKSEYFCKRGWTGTSKNFPLICPSG
jgi:hypothetical protein